MQPKFAPAEKQRQERLMSLYHWGRVNLKAENFKELEELDDINQEALWQLKRRALEMFGVATRTGDNYATIVYLRLKRELVKANDS